MGEGNGSAVLVVFDLLYWYISSIGHYHSTKDQMILLLVVFTPIFATFSRSFAREQSILSRVVCSFFYYRRDSNKEGAKRMKTVRGRFPHSVGEMSAKQTKGDESVRLFLPTGQRAKRGDRSGSSGKKSLRAGQKNTKSKDLVFQTVEKPCFAIKRDTVFCLCY